MILYLANSIIAIAQSFLLAEFFCGIFKLRYSKYKSLVLFFVSVYVPANFINAMSVPLRAIFSTLIFIIVLLILSNENFGVKLIKAFFGYSIFLILDSICVYLILPMFHLSVDFNLGVTPNVVLARNICSILMYIIVIVIKLIFNRANGLQFQLISVLFLMLGITELIILRSVFLSNQVGLRDNFTILAVICSVSIMLQYFISIDIFHHVLRQNKRYAELEQMKQERNYQYEYYLSAYQQNEQLRDMRHDMRNYLQTIQFLMEEGVDSNRVRQMIDELLVKIGDSFNKSKEI